MTLYPHMYQNVYDNLLQKKTSVYRNGIYISIWNSRKYSECVFMFRAILKTANSSFQKGMTFRRSIYVKKVMKLRGSVKKVLKTPVSEQRLTSF